MRFLKVFLSVCAFALGITGPVSNSNAAPLGNRFKVTTINIRFDGTPHGTSDGFDDWKYRKVLLANAVTENGPAVIGTQEGLQVQLKDFEQLLRRYRIVEGHRKWLNLFYPSFFVDPSQVNVLSSGDVWLSETPDVPGSRLPGSQWPRLFTWAKVRFLGCSPGRDVVLVNVHLDNEAPAIRQRQAEILVEQLRRLPGVASGVPVILLGDFNEKPMGPLRRTVANALPGLHDPWITLRLSEKSTYNGFNNKHFDAGAVGRIDWILLRGDFSFNWIQVDDWYRLHPVTGQPQFPSDHNPVKLETSLCR